MPRFYMAMLLAAGASVLFAVGIMFGVGIVTAPPERKTNATAEQLATGDGVRREAVQIGASKALTPIYPASPGQANLSVNRSETARAPETTGSGANITTNDTGDGANVTTNDNAATEIAVNEPPQALRVEPPQGVEPAQVDAPVASAEASPAAPADDIKLSVSAEVEAKPAMETVATKPDLEIATQRKPGRCNVAACSAAYRSFRASDCTFQPYEGPRQLCENPPAAQSTQTEEQPQRKATRERVLETGRDEDAELRAAVEAVKELTGPPSAGRRLVPFAERGRGQVACNVAACARAYDSFDPSDCTFQPYNGPRQLCTR